MIFNQVLNRMTIQEVFLFSSALFAQTLRPPGTVLICFCVPKVQTLQMHFPNYCKRIQHPCNEILEKHIAPLVGAFSGAP